jgi:hypothetical protein
MAVFFIPWIKQEVINKAETMDLVSASAELRIDLNNNLKLSLLNLVYQSVLMRTNRLLDRVFSQLADQQFVEFRSRFLLLDIFDD